ncbi:hypothetical protein [Lutispora thermophila]|uniref:Uncharacterized protein n=1 Tax=Lutispora thermophila DSM 19022 TaxID=1122184 RepID=A0A1M6IQ23_9FIRM|nr:hypothetical protein [Lutispora thermophila]SHJ36439.1 hypothetical protein SAMN02745176_03351 [Lutispora thermophila DSM 19022]
MKRIIAILLIISLILPILPVYATGKVIDIAYRNINGEDYAYASFNTTVTPGTTPIRFGTFGWNISFNGYKFLYEIDYNPNISIDYQIPLVDGSGLSRPSIQSRIRAKYGENSAIYKAWMELMETGGTITFDASIHRLDYGKITGPRANTLEEALALADWGSNTRRELAEEYYDRNAYVQPQPVKNNEVQASFKIFYKGNDVTNNSNKPALKDPDNLKLVLQDSSIVKDRSDPIIEWRWYYWYNGWISLDGMSGVQISEDKVAIDDMDGDLPGSLPLRKGFKLEVVTASGLEAYATAEAYFKQVDGDITVYYKDVSNDEDLYDPTYMKNLRYGTYTINAKPEPQDYKLITKSPVQVKISATNPSERVYFFYKKQSEEGKAGTIVAYYKDKQTNLDIMPTNVYSGLEFGIHQIDAAPAPEKYTLETPSPQMVEITQEKPFKEVIFYYKGDSSLYNLPPTAVIDAPDWVYAGEEFHVSGKRSYDRDGFIAGYQWEYDNEYTGCTLSDKKEGYIWFDYMNNGRIELTVRDNKGATDTARHYVDILPPIPVARITPSGKLKVNRKVTISAANSWSPRHYPIDHNRNEWKFSIPDMKYKGIFSGESKDVLFKQPGSKEFYLKVWNTYSDPTVLNGFSGEITDDFNIQPDLAPVADFSVPSVVLRDPKNENKATLILKNMSKSLDGDVIGKTVMFYAYDSNNDGKFDNETWYYCTDGKTWQPVGMPYDKIKTDFDIYTRGASNPEKFELVVDRNSVGKYKFEAMTMEDIPEEETIKEFLSPSDYLRADTFSSKPESEKICDVRNIAPTIDFEVKKIIPVDLVVVTDYIQDYDNLLSAIEVFRSKALPFDVEPKIHIVTEKKENVGTRKVDKYIWSRYINININGPAYNSYYNFHFNTNIKLGLESIELFDGEEEFPDRSKYTYKIDNWYISSYDNKSGSITYHYIHVDYSVYYNGQFQKYESKEINFAHGQYFNGLGTFFENYNDLKVTFDTSQTKTFVKAEEPFSSQRRPFNTIDVDRIKSLNIDGDSNKYILFCVDNYYNVVEIDTALKDYLNLNNFGIYIVASDKVLKETVLTGPWDDIYYVNGKKAYLQGNKLYQYEGKLLKEIPLVGRNEPIANDSITISMHDFGERYWYSRSDEAIKSEKLYENKYNVTVEIINGKVTVEGNTRKTTIDNVKALYKIGDYYIIERTNGDIYYFYRYVAVSFNDMILYQSMGLSDVQKLEGAKGVKATYTISYTKEYDHYYKIYCPTIPAVNSYLVDSRNNLFEATSRGSFTSMFYHENDAYYYICNSTSGNGGFTKIKSGGFIDFKPVKESFTGSYIDKYYNRKEYTYNEIKIEYITSSELRKKIPTDLDIDMNSDRDFISLAKLISGSLKGNTYGAKEYQKALDDILNDISGLRGASATYLLLNEKIKYEIQYSDYESDPENIRIWKYNHDPYYFENSMGLDPKSGKEITEPITSFSKVGKFEATLKTQDRPKDNALFKNYWMWSAEKKANIYVHRKPIALIKLNITPNGRYFRIEAIDGGSYDLDHESRPDKGIVAREWKWKELYDDTWKNERLNKSDCSKDSTYQVALRVKDLEGVWSDWTIETVDNKQPPVAKFDIMKNPITNLELPQIIDSSYAIMSNLTYWHWIVKKINDNGTIGAILQDVKVTKSNTGPGGCDTTLDLTRTNPGVGRYRIYLRVKADNGLWSDGGTDAAPNISKMFYRDLTVNQALDIRDISISGRWNHFRGWTDKFGVYKGVMKDVTYVDERGKTCYPYRFLSYEKIDISIKLEGYVDKVIIDFPDGLDRMTYTDKLGYTYSYREDVGYMVSFPYEIEIDPTLKDPEISWSYILPLVDSTVTWNNIRVKQPYTIRITAIKGTYEVIQEKKIDITGNVDDLIFIQPVAR